MKKITILFIILLFFLPNFVFWACSKYSAKISECNNALKDFIWRDKAFIKPWASIKSIEDFPCLQAPYEERVAQIIMDENFKKVNKNVEDELKNMYKSKDFYFWKDAKYTYIDWLRYIFSKSNEFLDSYNSACENSILELQSCFNNNPSISVDLAGKFLVWSNRDCYALAKTKTRIFWDIAYNSLLLNKRQISKDQKKLYQQWQRTKYDGVLDLLIINLSYIEKIWKAWPSKTKNTL